MENLSFTHFKTKNDGLVVDSTLLNYLHATIPWWRVEKVKTNKNNLGAGLLAGYNDCFFCLTEKQKNKTQINYKSSIHINKLHSLYLL